MQRRRVIKLLAYGAGLTGLSSLSMSQTAFAKPNMQLQSWFGEALGADVSLQFYHSDKHIADRIIENTKNILTEMEELFSLYRTNSVIRQLNDKGSIHNPHNEFIKLLNIAQSVSHHTNGAFDISVQPLWELHNSFSEEKSINNLIPFGNYRNIQISDTDIKFKKPNMAITLNGIAQGYITDRISDYFKSEGLTSVLIDMGEYRANGPQNDGEPWRIALVDPFNRNASSIDILEMFQGAVATSSNMIFGDGNDHNMHIFDPKTGKPATIYSSVTVQAEKAVIADALSTAFSSMNEKGIIDTQKKYPDLKVRLTKLDGQKVII